MRVEFFDDPLEEPRSRNDVRFNQLGLYIFEDRKRIAVGFDITPFRQRPSINVSITDKSGAEEASLSIIEVLQSNFNLTMHLRTQDTENPYHIQAQLYYRSDRGELEIVDEISREFVLSTWGEQ